MEYVEQNKAESNRIEQRSLVRKYNIGLTEQKPKQKNYCEQNELKQMQQNTLEFDRQNEMDQNRTELIKEIRRVNLV